MPLIDVVDSTWIAAPPERIAVAIAQPGDWARWFPGLRLVVTERRGVQGLRWRAERPGFTGTMEIWLQPELDGALAHYFLRLDAVGGRAISARRCRQVVEEHRWQAKRAFWAVADRLDPARLDRIESRDAPPSADRLGPASPRPDGRRVRAARQR